MAFKRERMRLTLSRWKKGSDFRKPDSQISLRAEEAKVREIKRLILGKSFYSTCINIHIDGLLTASAHLERDSSWSLSAEVPWLWSPENLQFIETELKGTYAKTGCKRQHSNLDEMLEYLFYRAELADCNAYWPVFLTAKGWRLSTMFKLDWEPFYLESEAMALLRLDEKALIFKALKASRLSPGEKVLEARK